LSILKITSDLLIKDKTLFDLVQEYNDKRHTFEGRANNFKKYFLSKCKAIDKRKKGHKVNANLRLTYKVCKDLYNKNQVR
jgi:hypothetical protein